MTLLSSIRLRQEQQERVPSGQRRDDLAPQGEGTLICSVFMKIFGKAQASKDVNGPKTTLNLPYRPVPCMLAELRMASFWGKFDKDMAAQRDKWGVSVELCPSFS